VGFATVPRASSDKLPNLESTLDAGGASRIAGRDPEQSSQSVEGALVEDRLPADDAGLGLAQQRAVFQDPAEIGLAPVVAEPRGDRLLVQPATIERIESPSRIRLAASRTRACALGSITSLMLAEQ
jgi:hypothetical protein